MKITYYGTAAGEAWPGVFCYCELCQKAARLGGKNIRTRSQAKVNEDLLLDFPPDNLLHRLHYGLDFRPIKTLLITHTHSDHLYTWDFELFREPFTHTHQGLKVCGNQEAYDAIEATGGYITDPQFALSYRVLQNHEPVEENGYHIMAFPAVHNRSERCLFYYIEKDGKRMIYAHDTGRFRPESLKVMQELGTPMDFVSLDCTTQKDPDGKNHMGFADCVAQKKELLELGIADKHTIFVVNHFSHNGGWLHEEITARAAAEGMLASYDGMVIEF